MIPVIFENHPQSQAAYSRLAALEAASRIDPSLIEQRWFMTRYKEAERAFRNAFKVGE